VAVFSIRSFMGAMPKVNPQLLPEGYATVATNTRLTHGDLRPWNQPSLVATPTKAGTKKTIYRFGESTGNDTSYWFTFTTDVNIFRAPIDGDASERTFYTGDGYPKKTDNSLALTGGTDYPVNAYKMGVPMPDTATSTYTVTGTPTTATDPSTNAAYVLTFVTVWGEEGRPSLPIGIASFKPGQAVNLAALPTAPTGNYNITAKRLYRSNTGNTGTTYQFVAELPIATTTYVDTKTAAQLKEVVITWGWEEPPDDGFGLTLGANGNAIMCSGKTIYPCIPFIFYAYPPEYQQSVDSQIVGVGAFGQNFAILTKSNPYILSGADPASYSLTKVEMSQACVAKRSIVSMMGGVVYASPEGLYMVSTSGVTSLTKNLFTKEDWQALQPDSIHAYVVNGRYQMFYDTGAVQGSMLFDFADDPFVVFSSDTCTAAYNDPLRDALYMAQGSNINKFDGGTAATYTWRSKDYRSSWYINPGYGKVEADAYPVTFKLYVDGTLKHTQSVTSKAPFRLPSTEGMVVAVEVSGTAKVNCVALAETGEEINQA
jgi:hypothetical protein